MSPTAGPPDELDFAILQAMYRNGAVNLAGIDPRLNATRVAKTLRIGRSRVAARLRWWRESGFLRKYAVWPNPAHLGWLGAGSSVRVDHPRTKPGLFERLALIDGVVSGLDFVGEWIGVSLVAPDRRAIERRLELIRHFAGVREVDPPQWWRVPEPKQPLTPLELRIVMALRAQPTAALSAIARQVGISTRTMTRRYTRLLEDWSVWFVPVFDFTAFPVPIVAVTAQLREGADGGAVGRVIREHFPLTLGSASSVVGPEWTPGNYALFFVALPSAARLDELQRVTESAEGVVGAESYLLVRVYEFPEWFDHQLKEMAHEPGRGATGRTARKVRTATS